MPPVPWPFKTMPWLAILSAWTAAAAAWWILSWLLVKSAAPSPEKETGGEISTERLVIFKPLPPLGAKGLLNEAAGLESFIAQLDQQSTLLMGAHEADRATVLPFIEGMLERYPEAHLQVLFSSEAAQGANPKIAWQKVLTARAEGDWWMWSDADIVAPPGFLRRARAEFLACGAKLLTFPYAVKTIAGAPQIMDALFVNVDFLPGVLLLRRRGPVDFGLGAALLFRRDDFLRHVDWDRLQNSLADDFVLGQLLQPVSIGTSILGTVSDVEDWPAALAHYLRWNKTIRWCRPWGFAAQLVNFPVLGWLIFTVLHPGSLVAWLGLVLTTQAEIFMAMHVSRYAGCHLDWKQWPGLMAWSLFRVIAWVLCWLPLPVRWRTRLWWRPSLEFKPANP